MNKIKSFINNLLKYTIILGLVFILSKWTIYHFINTKEPVPVSIIELIANPQKYNNRKIRVTAFLNLEFEGNAIYLSPEDYYHLTGNCILIDPNDMILSKKQILKLNYVLIEGKFHALHKFDRYQSFGVISEITRAEQWSTLDKPRRLLYEEQRKN